MKNAKLTAVLTSLALSPGFIMAQDQADLLPAPPPKPDVRGEAQLDPFVSDQEVRLAASQDQLKQAERASATSQRAMQFAQARAGEAGRTFARSMSGMRYRNGSEGRTLVIPKDASDAKNLAEVQDDMNVMAHILDKAASRDSKSARAMGIPVFDRTPSGGTAPQNLCIEGYGDLFFLNVNYPLLLPPEKSSETDAREKTPTEWEQARREMAQPASPGGADAFLVFDENFKREFAWNGGPPAPYDANQVEELKSDLISALKNTANIRKLRADETVTVVVTGTSAGGMERTIKAARGGAAAGQVRNGEVEIEEMTGSDPAPAGAPAKLILRVRKADAEAFQNGKLSGDEFKKKVSTVIY